MVLRDKVALVTGAAQGIGRAAALELARNGVHLAVSDINADALEQTSIDIREMGQRCVAIQADMGSLNDIDRMVTEAADELGGIDILFNNAGITWHRDFFDIVEDDWDKIHRVNAKGAFFCMQRTARQMVEQGRGGRIINTASIAGKGFRDTSNAAYAASKGAVISMTLIAAHQLAKHDINVNAICPGVTRTSMLENFMAKRSNERGVSQAELEAELARTVPIGRYNEPDDIAAMTVFLAGPGARNITGQTFNVDGGLVMG
jgi:NAD(P)-dependent dehydrogenase (short-subunit alcohol dehydrogenase family)